jgi:hypothetical protein
VTPFSRISAGFSFSFLDFFHAIRHFTIFLSLIYQQVLFSLMTLIRLRNMAVLGIPFLPPGSSQLNKEVLHNNITVIFYNILLGVSAALNVSSSRVSQETAFPISVSHFSQFWNFTTKQDAVSSTNILAD